MHKPILADTIEIHFNINQCENTDGWMRYWECVLVGCWVLSPRCVLSAGIKADTVIHLWGKGRNKSLNQSPPQRKLTSNIHKVANTYIRSTCFMLQYCRIKVMLLTFFASVLDFIAKMLHKLFIKLLFLFSQLITVWNFICAFCFCFFQKFGIFGIISLRTWSHMYNKHWAVI